MVAELIAHSGELDDPFAEHQLQKLISVADSHPRESYKRPQLVPTTTWR